MVIKESHCRGFEGGRTRTLKQWMHDQGVVAYNEINDRLMQIISLKNRLIPGPLDDKSRNFFNLALYNLDEFKSQIQNHGLLDDFNADDNVMDAAFDDDVALLDLGMKWVERMLFNH